jgi:hypothetical protein
MNCPQCGEDMESRFIVIDTFYRIGIRWKKGDQPSEPYAPNPMLNAAVIEAFRCHECEVVRLLMRSHRNEAKLVD